MSKPQSITVALTYATTAVVAAYIFVGLSLSSIFASAASGQDQHGVEHGVQQVILMNLPPTSLLSAILQLSSALVAILSFPLPLVPLVELSSARLASAFARPPPPSTHLRLALLTLTSSLASAVSHFGTLAAFIGCLSVLVSNVLPPLVHLLLCSHPHRKASPAPVIFDAALLALGIVSLVYFTSLTGIQLLSGPSHDG